MNRESSIDNTQNTNINTQIRIEVRNTEKLLPKDYYLFVLFCFEKINVT